MTASVYTSKFLYNMFITFKQPDSIYRHNVRMLLQSFVPAALLFHLSQGACVIYPILCVQHYVFIWGLLLLKDFDWAKHLGNGLFVGCQIRKYFIAILGLLWQSVAICSSHP